MKGLIFKELYLTRKYRMIGAGIYLVLILMAVLVKLSSLHGNIKLLQPSVVAQVLTVTYYIMVYGGAVVITVSGLTEQICADEKTHFRRFSHTLPISEYEIVGSVFLLNLAGTVFSFAVSVVNMLIANAIFDMDLKGMNVLYLLAISMVMTLFYLGKTCLVYHFRDEKKSKTVITVISTALYFGVCLGFMKLMDSYCESRGYSMGDDSIPDEIMDDFFHIKLKGILDTITDNLWWGIPTIAVGLMLLFYFLSVKSLKRRGV